MDSNVLFRRGSNRFACCPADSVLDITSPDEQRLYGDDVQTFLAQQAAWLLNRSCLRDNIDHLRGAYLWCLAERAMQPNRGRTRIADFMYRFCSAVQPDMASQNRLRSGAPDRSWLCRLIRKTNCGQLPIRHLLLMHFLGVTPEFMLAEGANIRPFTVSPWSCLNNVCALYHQGAIKTCNIHFARSGGRPIASFLCSRCGVEYSRSGPDSCAQDRLTRDHITIYGPIWDSAL